MELFIKDRIYIPQLLPQQTKSFMDFNVKREILKKVAAEENAAVNDLYSVVAPKKPEMIGEDHIHLTPAGIEAAAEQTAAVLRAMLLKETGI